MSHEFGHAIDNHIRSALHPAALTNPTASEVELADYYIDILLSDFAACMHSATAVSKAQFHALARHASQYIDTVMPERQSYKYHLPWFILIQQAQLVGTVLLGNELGNPTPLRWSGVTEGSIEVLHGFIEDLRGLASRYPRWEQPEVQGHLRRRSIELSRTI